MRIAKLVTLTAAATLVAATTAGCGGGDDSESATTTAATTNADGTTVGGTELTIGDKAVVPFDADDEDSSKIKLVVSKVDKGKIRQMFLGGRDGSFEVIGGGDDPVTRIIFDQILQRRRKLDIVLDDQDLQHRP